MNGNRNETISASPQELDRRDSDGLEVRLLWYEAQNRLTIEVFDDLFRQMFEFDVAPQCAADALVHPYAYAPTQIVLRAPAPRLDRSRRNGAGRCRERQQVPAPARVAA